LVVGAVRVHLRLPGNGTLKDKRRVVRGLLDRARHRFNVAAAEVDDQDRRDRAVLALVCVSGDAVHVDRMMTALVNWIDAQVPGQVVHVEREFR